MSSDSASGAVAQPSITAGRNGDRLFIYGITFASCFSALRFFCRQVLPEFAGSQEIRKTVRASLVVSPPILVSVLTDKVISSLPPSGRRSTIQFLCLEILRGHRAVNCGFAVEPLAKSGTESASKVPSRWTPHLLLLSFHPTIGIAASYHTSLRARSTSSSHVSPLALTSYLLPPEGGR